MKKFMAVIAGICFVFILFSGCGKSGAVKNTQKLINAIGTVGIDSEARIAAAEKQYDILSDEEKNSVRNYKKLLAAREKYDSLVFLNNGVSELLADIGACFNSYGITAKAVNERFSMLSAKYNELSGDEKEQIKDFASLEAAYKEFCNASVEAQEAACAYVKAFYKLNEGKDCKITDIGCIIQDRDKKRFTMLALAYENAAGEKINVYSSARFAGIPSENTMLKYSDSFFASAPVSEEMNALENGNVIIDVPSVLAAAK